MLKRAAFVASFYCVFGCGGRSVSTHPGESGGTSPGSAAGSSARPTDDSGRGGASPWETLSHTLPPPPSSSDDVTWHGQPPGYAAVWSDSAEHAWVTSGQGNYKGPPSFQLLRWEAGDFSSEDTTCRHSMGGLAALSASDMWITACDGGVEHRAGATWSWLGGSADPHIWESSPSDVWTCCSPVGVNDAYVPSHWDGAVWSAVPLASNGHHGGPLWARSFSDAWIGNDDDSTVFHWDGSAWATLSLPPNDGWRGIAGDTDGIWLVAAGGSVVRGVDGGLEGWQSMGTEAVLASPVALNAVWAAGPTDVWIVGDAGTILHWDGTRFTREDSNVTASLSAVWGAAGVVWVAGSEATLLRRAD